MTVIDALGLSDAYVAREAALANQRPGHINRAVVTDYFRVRADLTLQRDWEARVRKLDPTVRAKAIEDSLDPAWADGQAHERYERIRELVSGPMAVSARLRVGLRFLLPRYPRHGEQEVLAENGEWSVRANYRPQFGTFKTLIGAAEGAGDGADWFDPTAAVGMNDRNSRVTVDLGKRHILTEVSLQADADDTYVVRFSENGKDFGSQWVAAPIPGLGGLQTRRTPDGFTTAARYLQVSVVAGDAFHSLGRLDVVTEAGRQARVPGQPKWREPSASAGDGEATITWKAPADGGQKITKYIVRSIPPDVTVEVGAPAGGATIAGLQNGTEYRFTVTAVNEVGEGPTSEPSNAVRPVENVVAMRGNVKVRASFTPRSGKFSALLVDPIPPDGTAFLDANLAFAWNNPASRLIVDLSQTVAITRLTLQGDNNDEYVVEFSADGKQFGDRQVFAAVGAPGLRTRETPADFIRQARYLRIGGGVGDTTFALGALEVYSGSVPVIRR
ncbi:MAG: hypothetical protein EPO65_07405 [Dehalococcoidia bacterium]|nr:MAG: hypothetical protein EPO65_07405 [Dehalococcoidia bacterium]